MNMHEIMEFLGIYFLGWPLIITCLIVGLVCTIAFNFIQIRYFCSMWRSILRPAEKLQAGADVTPLQAFINTMSANIGNGSLAGMAAAIATGGPGAVFWVAAIGVLLMSVRFAEVYLSIYYGKQSTTSSGLGGPMLYLQYVPGGSVLPTIYAAVMLVMSLIVGNAMQVNTIGLSLNTTWDIPTWITAIVSSVLIFYIVTGGAQRISAASEKIVPLKVIIFFSTSLTILAYHWNQIGSALQLIWHSAFHETAAVGAVLGFSVQQAMRFGTATSIFATESGLGSAAIFFGFTKSKTPMQDSILSMLNAFITTIVCVIIGLCIIVSGTWTTGLTSSQLTIATYQTTFGSLGGLIVTFLSIAFGIGVIVSFAYIVKETWAFLTGGRFSLFINIVYCLVAFAGTLASVKTIFSLVEIFNGAVLFINLYGILCLVPVVAREVSKFRAEKHN
ncbi:MAG TPA: amino acid carrier protein [Candidatus Babeliales bacterium]|nr:amino acid carrier protein [Candidatus Babeliales bacterium]